MRLTVDLAVLIIAYTRPEGVSYLLESLIISEVRDIYVSIDGPRNEIDKINNKKIKDILVNGSQQSKSRIHINEQKNNLGVAAGVISAVDWFFSNEERGIILEDDILVGKDFFKFALDGLNEYQGDPDVWMISGTQIFPDVKNNLNAVWANYPMIWGWGSWEKKWSEMRSVLLHKKRISIRNLSNPVHLFWAVGGNRALSGKVDTWDTQLAYEFIVQKKLCLLPPVNLISNIGNDEFASHTKRKNETMNLEIFPLPNNYILKNNLNRLKLKSYNSLLEKQVFKIKPRHLLLPYYSFLFDFIKFPKYKRKSPLISRVS
jgi:hypothetical protein